MALRAGFLCILRKNSLLFWCTLLVPVAYAQICFRQGFRQLRRIKVRFKNGPFLYALQMRAIGSIQSTLSSAAASAEREPSGQELMVCWYRSGNKRRRKPVANCDVTE
jgi:hypothetical protein